MSYRRCLTLVRRRQLLCMALGKPRALVLLKVVVLLSANFTASIFLPRFVARLGLRIILTRLYLFDCFRPAAILFFFVFIFLRGLFLFLVLRLSLVVIIDPVGNSRSEEALPRLIFRGYCRQLLLECLLIHLVQMVERRVHSEFAFQNLRVNHRDES